MLRTSTLPLLLSICLFAPTGAALAQQQNAPAQLEVIEDTQRPKDPRIGVEPADPAKPKPGVTQITEKKEGGRVTEVKVKSGLSTYTMKPNTPAGNAQPGDATSNGIRAPQWTVMEFDLNKRKKKAAAEGKVDAPPPQTTAPAKPAK